MIKYEFKAEKENGFIYADSCTKEDGILSHLGYYRYDEVIFLVDDVEVKRIENVISLKEIE